MFTVKELYNIKKGGENMLGINQVQMPVVKEIPIKNEMLLTKNPKFTLMSKVNEDQFDEIIKEMITKITEQGEKIQKHMDLRDIKEYRMLISEFMNEVVSKSHKFSRENYLDRHGRYRVYGMIKKVDLKLDELALELIKVEKNSIAILDKIGEIEGLVLDFIT